MSEPPLLYCHRCGTGVPGPGRGRIFQDARGGFECTDCDARYLIVQEPPHGYGGPRGQLSFVERYHRGFCWAGAALSGLTGAFLAQGNGLATLIAGILGMGAWCNGELGRRDVDAGREKPG